MYIHALYIYIDRERDRERGASQVALAVKNLPVNARAIRDMPSSRGSSRPRD